MNPQVPVAAVALAIGTLLALYGAATARRPARASRTLAWLMLAVAEWCLMGALHWTAPTLDAKIVEQHEGTLNLESTPGAGSTFIAAPHRPAPPGSSSPTTTRTCGKS